MYHLSEKTFIVKVLNKRPHMVLIPVSYSDVDRNNGSEFLFHKLSVISTRRERQSEPMGDD